MQNCQVNSSFEDRKGTDFLGQMNKVVYVMLFALKKRVSLIPFLQYNVNMKLNPCPIQQTN